MKSTKFQPFTGPEHEVFQLDGGEAAALLVHGFPGTPAEVRPLAEALHGAGWTVHAPLLPGFGADFDTLFEREHTEWVNAVAGALQALQADHHPVVLVGYSMGAAVALNVTATAASPPAALILLAPFWQLTLLEGWRRALWPLLRIIFREAKPFKNLDFDDPQVREGMTDFLPDVNLDDPEVREAIREQTVPARILDELRALGQSAYQRAPQARVPTLILQGMEDELVAPEQTRRLLQRMPCPLTYHEIIADHDLLNPEGQHWSAIRQRIFDFLSQIELSVLRGKSC
jgi:carboxylesterase